MGQLVNKQVYKTTIPVRIYDVNYGNHLGHDSLVSLLHEARVAFLTSLNLSEIDVFGSGLILVELHVSYVSQAFYGDKLDIAIYIQDITAASLELGYKVTREGLEVANARTKLVFYDYAERKVKKIPSEFIRLLESLSF